MSRVDREQFRAVAADGSEFTIQMERDVVETQTRGGTHLARSAWRYRTSQGHRVERLRPGVFEVHVEGMEPFAVTSDDPFAQ